MRWNKDEERIRKNHLGKWREYKVRAGERKAKIEGLNTGDRCVGGIM